MFHRNNKHKETKPLFQMKTSYEKVIKAMTEPPKDYDTIKDLVENKKRNILDLNIQNSKNINLTKTKNKKIKNKIKYLILNLYNGQFSERVGRSSN